MSLFQACVVHTALAWSCVVCPADAQCACLEPLLDGLLVIIVYLSECGLCSVFFPPESPCSSFVVNGRICSRMGVSCEFRFLGFG